jgi:hypothetical protein
MFGQQDDQTNNDQPVPPPTDTNYDDLKPADILGNQPPPDLSQSENNDPDLPAVVDDKSSTVMPHNLVSISSPIPDLPAETGLPSSSPVTPGDDSHRPVMPPSDLLDLKNQALHELEPLVDHLDQTPEEKFKTTLMMIQASDNQSLIQQAFETAQRITDDKERAQALLDLVNEINYFTQINKAA